MAGDRDPRNDPVLPLHGGGVTALQRKWEARLKRDGLASLDCAVGGEIMVSNAGAGKLKTDTAQARREAAAVEMDRRRDIVRRGKFATPRDRRIWSLHADGVGYQTIARTVGQTQWSVRLSLAEPKGSEGSKGSEVSRKNIPGLVHRSDTGVLFSLLEAIWNARR